jgi:ABC-2 family transporter protein
VAVLHEPAILILDEPTSGVDPIARDAFWRSMIDLSRDDGVTIFLSTHFMNEAERCDRISLMHAGKVLAVGTPADLVKERGSASLEDTFVGYLADAAGIDRTKKVEAPPLDAGHREAEAIRPPRRFDVGRLWAYARREAVELLRDPIRLAFAIFGPIILMLAFGYGISFDIENLQMAAFDQDNTPQSRQLLDGFSGSRYFSVQPPIKSATEAERRLRSGNTQVVVEVPAGFGRDLLRGARPEVDASVDGAMTFRGETARNYVTGVVRTQGEELERQARKAGSPNAWNDGDIQTRFRYNQAFLSVNAMVPSVFMLMLCLIPAIMSAIAVVREKETGSIANFRANHQIRVSARQAGSLHRRCYGELRLFAVNGDLCVRRSAQGTVSHAADRHHRLCDRDHRLRPVDLVFYPHPSGGGVCHRDPVDRPRSQFLWPLRAGVVALGNGESSRPVVPFRLVSADRRRCVRQGAGDVRSLVQCRRDRHHCGRLPDLVAPIPTQTGGVTCRRPASSRFQDWPKRG